MAWKSQLASSVDWDRRWRLTVAEIEETKEFRAAVGVSEVKAWSHEEARLGLGQKRATPAFYEDFVSSLAVLHIILALAAAFTAFIK